jgi:hypothetical protein
MKRLSVGIVFLALLTDSPAGVAPQGVYDAHVPRVLDSEGRPPSRLAAWRSAQASCGNQT